MAIGFDLLARYTSIECLHWPSEANCQLPNQTNFHILSLHLFHHLCVNWLHLHIKPSVECQTSACTSSTIKRPLRESSRVPPGSSHVQLIRIRSDVRLAFAQAATRYRCSLPHSSPRPYADSFSCSAPISCFASCSFLGLCYRHHQSQLCMMLYFTGLSSLAPRGQSERRNKE